jgi:hypothetical protein
MHILLFKYEYNLAKEMNMAFLCLNFAIARRYRIIEVSSWFRNSSVYLIF